MPKFLRLDSEENALSLQLHQDRPFGRGDTDIERALARDMQICDRDREGNEYQHLRNRGGKRSSSLEAGGNGLRANDGELHITSVLGKRNRELDDGLGEPRREDAFLVSGASPQEVGSPF